MAAQKRLVIHSVCTETVDDFFSSRAQIIAQSRAQTDRCRQL